MLKNTFHNNCLVIIDMQWEFLRNIKKTQHLNNLIYNIVKKIIYFKNNNLPIVILEYYLDCVSCIKNLQTASKILKEVTNYKNLYYTTKITDSGCDEIIESLKGNKNYKIYNESYQNQFINLEHKPIYFNYEKWNFYLVGVNTSACVLDTAIDLYRKYGYKSFIPMFCSYDTISDEWPYQIEDLKEDYVRNIVELVT